MAGVSYANVGNQKLNPGIVVQEPPRVCISMMLESGTETKNEPRY